MIDEEIKSVEDKITEYEIESKRSSNLEIKDLKYFDVLQNIIRSCFGNLNQMPVNKKFEVF